MLHSLTFYFKWYLIEENGIVWTLDQFYIQIQITFAEQ